MYIDDWSQDSFSSSSRNDQHRAVHRQALERGLKELLLSGRVQADRGATGCQGYLALAQVLLTISRHHELQDGELSRFCSGGHLQADGAAPEYQSYIALARMMLTALWHCDR
jgi:hypothetical protein